MALAACQRTWDRLASMMSGGGGGFHGFSHWPATLQGPWWWPCLCHQGSAAATVFQACHSQSGHCPSVVPPGVWQTGCVGLRATLPVNSCPPPLPVHSEPPRAPLIPRTLPGTAHQRVMFDPSGVSKLLNFPNPKVSPV